MKTADVFGTPISVGAWQDYLDEIYRLAAERRGGQVSICNVHSVVTARADEELADALRTSEICTPDGAPVAWMLRRQGFSKQVRINGPDLMRRTLALGEKIGTKFFFYGSTPEVLDKLLAKLKHDFPLLEVVGTYSPPFRALSTEELGDVTKLINNCGAQIVWVGLGCPKQEKWMKTVKREISAPMIGVGAAFDYFAGTVPRAPLWMQNAGLEWLYRLLKEPRRLWRRYLHTNTVFVLLFIRKFFQRSL